MRSDSAIPASGPGRVVLLNGPSSAGKSSLARELVALMPTPWMDLPVDLVHSIRSRPDLAEPPPDSHSMTPDEWQQVFRRSRAGYHRMLAGLAVAGNDVVADHVLNEPWRIADLLEVLDGIPTLLVHVAAPLEVLEARELSRGDREIGAARLQHEAVFVHGDCDLQLDTSLVSTQEGAVRVKALVDGWPSSTAFERMRGEDTAAAGNRHERRRRAARMERSGAAAEEPRQGTGVSGDDERRGWSGAGLPPRSRGREQA